MLQIDYIDCNGEAQWIKLRYQTIGWMFYSDETLFKLMHWAVTCIFVFTSIRLGYLLGIEQITNEYR